MVERLTVRVVCACTYPVLYVDPTAFQVERTARGIPSSALDSWTVLYVIVTLVPMPAAVVAAICIEYLAGGCSCERHTGNALDGYKRRAARNISQSKHRQYTDVNVNDRLGLTVHANAEPSSITRIR